MGRPEFGDYSADPLMHMLIDEGSFDEAESMNITFTSNYEADLTMKMVAGHINEHFEDNFDNEDIPATQEEGIKIDALVDKLERRKKKC